MNARDWFYSQPGFHLADPMDRDPPGTHGPSTKFPGRCRLCGKAWPCLAATEEKRDE